MKFYLKLYVLHARNHTDLLIISRNECTIFATRENEIGFL